MGERNVMRSLMVMVLLTGGVDGSAQARPPTESDLCDLTNRSNAAGRWAGDCRNGKPEGHGAARVKTEGGIGVFTGRAVGGTPVSGVTELPDGGLMMTVTRVPHVRKDMDQAAMETEQAFKDAFDGAATASRTYRQMGNAPSSEYYAEMRRRLMRGQPE